jgi:hypothetical protein
MLQIECHHFARSALNGYTDWEHYIISYMQLRSKQSTYLVRSPSVHVLKLNDLFLVTRLLGGYTLN